MSLRSLMMLGLAAALLSACGAPREGPNAALPNASAEEAAAAAYRHDGPPALTLYTMINNRSGSGAHTSLMINADQRVVFDPAGTVRLTAIPEINDVLYGMTPRKVHFYEGAHARSTFHVRIQRIEVSAEVAQKALRLAQQAGPVPSAQCTTSTTQLLQQLPGFEGIKSTWFPNNLADQFATFPGVTERVLREDDADDKTIAIRQFEAQQAQGG